jgi:hypothetical protein
MGGASGRSHCGRWVVADYTKHGTGRLVCSLPAHHGGGWHTSGWSGWMWSTWWSPGRAVLPEIVRDWSCRGWVEELKGMCGRTFRGTEDAARVKGWRIQLGGVRDQLCPQCGKPDPVTVGLARELERSVAR